MTTTRSFTSLGICVAILVAGAVFVRSVPAAPARAVAKASVATGKSSYGQILFDGRGFALRVHARHAQQGHVLRRVCDGDKAPGVVLCQNVPEFRGTWLVLRGSGKLVR